MWVKHFTFLLFFLDLARNSDGEVDLPGCWDADEKEEEEEKWKEETQVKAFIERDPDEDQSYSLVHLVNVFVAQCKLSARQTIYVEEKRSGSVFFPQILLLLHPLQAHHLLKVRETDGLQAEIEFFQFSKRFTRFTLSLDRSFWYEQAKANLQKNSQFGDKENRKTKNIILFIGDGLGMTTVTAARIFRGQRNGMRGEETDLVFDKFEHTAFVKTYNLDSQVGESGACATALFCGVKARYETIGLDSNGFKDDCTSSILSRVPSIAQWAQEQGFATGFVTTTKVTHATPAGLYAHTPNRFWEGDASVPSEARGICKDIARQLIEDEPGSNFNVILGGGTKFFLPVTELDPHLKKEQGRRYDNKNLIKEWMSSKSNKGLRHEFVSNSGELSRVNITHTDYLLGLFNSNHMSFDTERDSSELGEPSLQEMTRKAIQILSKFPRGYFLLVEGGRIDHAHHTNNAFKALTETLALEDAIGTAVSMTKPTETLIVLTADHSHVLTFGGRVPKRGNDILGTDSSPSDIDNFPYTTLLYGNGPGYRFKQRSNATSIPIDKANFAQETAVPKRWGTHGGEDVPLYASGVNSHLFRGVIEQSYIPHALAYAACIGPFSATCQINVTPMKAAELNCTQSKTQTPLFSHASQISQMSKLLILNVTLFIHSLLTSYTV